MVGYGVGFEGVDGGKLYVGVYTPEAEYGWVVTNREIYLDTVFQKTIDK
jgi:two-component SAPR family response regulator